MRTFDSDPVEVRLEACYCPGSPHEADIVYLAPQLSMAGGMAAQSAISEGITDARLLQEMLAAIWIRHGVIGWNLVDEDGDPLPTDGNTLNVTAADQFNTRRAMYRRAATITSLYDFDRDGHVNVTDYVIAGRSRNQTITLLSAAPPPAAAPSVREDVLR